MANQHQGPADQVHLEEIGQFVVDQQTSMGTAEEYAEEETQNDGQGSQIEEHGQGIDAEDQLVE